MSLAVSLAEAVQREREGEKEECEKQPTGTGWIPASQNLLYGKHRRDPGRVLREVITSTSAIDSTANLMTVAGTGAGKMVVQNPLQVQTRVQPLPKLLDPSSQFPLPELLKHGTLCSGPGVGDGETRSDRRMGGMVVCAVSGI